MKTKTCGECKYFNRDLFFCKLDKECRSRFPAQDICGLFELNHKITNGDKIRQMSDGVLAFAMTRLILEGCPISGAKTIEDMKACKISTDCTNCLKRLLNEEAKDE